ncbi:PREDICTED: proline-rich protein 2-like [Vollenhovia emeryi]|uniref:proline-rich protein 2-like n=1 Tax=Vollenhovia emeryi TaxID=411798 RepID=UPI0005F4247F|nr:PREDICTED: proline-rich protein 2-like [Vollenhovia emeryi]
MSAFRRKPDHGPVPPLRAAAAITAPGQGTPPGAVPEPRENQQPPPPPQYPQPPPQKLPPPYPHPPQKHPPPRTGNLHVPPIRPPPPTSGELYPQRVWRPRPPITPPARAPLAAISGPAPSLAARKSPMIARPATALPRVVSDVPLLRRVKIVRPHVATSKQRRNMPPL